MPKGRGVAPDVVALADDACGVAEDGEPSELCVEDCALNGVDATGGVESTELKGYDGTEGRLCGTAGTVRSLGKAGTDGT